MKGRRSVSAALTGALLGTLLAAGLLPGIGAGPTSRRIIWPMASAAAASPRLGSDANPADLLDPFAYGVNPALDEMTFTQLAAGFQVLHWGLLENTGDLNTGGVIWAGRKSFGGVSLGLSYLATPLWGDRQVQAGYGRRVLAGLSLGVGVGLNQRAFDTSGMDLSHGSYDDPLLTGSLSRTVPTLSLAAAYSLPLEGVTAGVVLENPHKPNISIGGWDDSVYLPQTWRAGLSWERELFQVTAGLVDDDLRTRVAGTVRTTILGGHGLLGRFDTDQWSVGARFVVTPRVWCEYTFTQPRSELSSAASGTHGIVICLHGPGRAAPPVTYDHAPLPVVATPAPPAVAPVSIPSPEPVALTGPEPPATYFQVTAAVDTALVRIKRVKRRFAPGVDMAQVRSLPRWRIGVLDSTWSDRITWDVTEGMTPAHPEGERPQGNYSEAYQNQMDALRSDLAGAPGTDLIIAADDAQLDRARYLARQVAGDSLQAGRVAIRRLQPPVSVDLYRRLLQPVGRDSIPASEEITLYQFDVIPFDIAGLGPADHIAAWSLEIRDVNGWPVRNLGGRGAPPRRVGWDWRDQRGHRVDVDSYVYRLVWQDTDGALRHTPDREILIARQVMQRTLDFGTDQKPRHDLERAHPVLILDPGRDGLSVGRPTPTDPAPSTNLESESNLEPGQGSGTNTEANEQPTTRTESNSGGTES